MQPSAFAYHRPGTVDEAIQLLTATDGARALAGGHSLLPSMKLRLSNPEALIDIGRVEGLSGIDDDGDHVEIGALVTHAEIENSELIGQEVPVLAETAGQIGDLQVRNRGTIGGSLAHADPAADIPTTILALEATINVQGPGGSREIAASEFFTGLFATALADDELITSVRVHKLGAGHGSAYIKHKHPASGYAVVGAAAIVDMANGSIDHAHLAVGGVTANPATVDVSGLAGAQGSDDDLAQAAGGVAAALGDPIGDVYASGEFRVHLAEVLSRRALSTAFARATS